MQIYAQVTPEIDNETFKILSEQQIKVISEQSFEEKQFSFSHICFDNQELYSQTQDQVEQAIEYHQNMCFVAYGQSGTGKSHVLGFNENPGMFHFIVKQLFQKYASLSISLIQLHANFAFDLFDMNNNLSEHKIRLKGEDCIVENLNEIIVNDLNQATLLCGEAFKRNTNKFKCHTVLTIKTEHFKIQFVEVAIPIAKQPGYSQGCMSITALFQVLKAIQSQSTVFPFRDSKLTQLLKNSLKSPARVFLIGTMEGRGSQQTLYTLQALQSCSGKNNKIKTEPKKQNEEISDLTQYLLTILTRINEHTCQLLNIRSIGQIDTQHPSQSIQQVQSISLQLLDNINRLAQGSGHQQQFQQHQQHQQHQQQQQQQQQYESQSSPNSANSSAPIKPNFQIKIDSWTKAFQFLYNAYEEEIQREDKLIKQKLIYIINEDEQYDNEQLKLMLFPQKQNKVNSLQNTLFNLRKFTNTMKIPFQNENYHSSTIQSIYNKETNKQSSIIMKQQNQAEMQCQITGTLPQQLMNKYKGLVEQDEQSMEIQQDQV